LAKGLPLVEAVREAKDYVTGAIAAADRLKVGSGHGPVHHFYRWWAPSPANVEQARDQAKQGASR
jgi:hydroxymethylpyrimidine/phosphomethylpyrimidine kinase